MARKKVDLEIRDAFRFYIDEEKQRIVAKGLIEDNRLFSQLHRVIVPDAFGELNVRIMMGEVMHYYETNKKVPSYDILDVLLMNKANTELERDEFKALLQFLKEDKTLSDLHDLKDHAIRFFKQQETIKITNKLIKSIKDGYDDNKLRNLLDEAKEILTPTDNDLGSNPMDYMEEIFNDEEEEKVPTGYMELDAVLGGGLQKGNVGLLAAHTGAGKTTFSTAMAVQSAILGYNVLQITFEESEKDIIKKQYACLTADYVSNMTKSKISEKTKQKIREWMPTINERIKVKRLRNTRTTWEEVENYIFNLQMVQNFNPDVIFIDYFDCLKHSTNPTLSNVNAAVRCIKKIDDFAKIHKYAIWVMQQTNRQGAQSATKGDVEGNIQGAFAVQQTTAVNMYLTKSEEEKAYNKATLTLKKNRQGSLCTFESFEFNNGTLQIDMSKAHTSYDVEKTISEFSNKQKKENWVNVQNDLRQEYIETQTNGCTNTPQMYDNQTFKMKLDDNPDNYVDPRDTWPIDFN